MNTLQVFQNYGWEDKSSVSSTFIVIRIRYKVVFLNNIMLIDTDIEINVVVKKEKQFIIHNIACFFIRWFFNKFGDHFDNNI